MKPVMTTMAPKLTVAWLRSIPRTRSRNAGIQNARPPNAKVYAAYPRMVSRYGLLRSNCR